MSRKSANLRTIWKNKKHDGGVKLERSEQITKSEAEGYMAAGATVLR